MAKMQIKGLASYEQAISRLERRLKDEVIGEALYDGAKILADAIREDIEGLETDDRSFTADGGKLKGPKTVQVYGLLDSLGVARMRNDLGVYDVKVGFDGYNKVRTKRWPKGQPNQMVARSIERGTSFMDAQPVFKRTVSRLRGTVQDVMGKSVEKSIDRIMKKKNRDEFWYSEFKPG